MRVSWMVALAIFFCASATRGELSTSPVPLSCECSDSFMEKSCGIRPAFFSKSENQVNHELGFDVPGDNVHMAGTVKGLALYIAFATFLEKSDRARMFYPEFYTKAAKTASQLTLSSVYVPKNATEMDEYFRCTIPKERYCLYRKSLRPYLGLAAKASRIPYAFLACQAYVESRFDSKAVSHKGAVGYSQVQAENISYLNEILKRSIHNTFKRNSGRAIASSAGPRQLRVNQAQSEIAKLWQDFWKDTQNVPSQLCENDLTCYRQAFLAQVLAMKSDMLAFATSSSSMKAELNEKGNFVIEGMDPGDSLLLLAASYNLGVTKVIRLISKYCGGATKLKECLDQMKKGANSQSDENLVKDVNAATHYILRIRDCSQQFSAEKIDFDDDDRWTDEVRVQKHNQQRDESVQCLLNPCPYQ